MYYMRNEKMKPSIFYDQWNTRWSGWKSKTSGEWETICLGARRSAHMEEARKIHEKSSCRNSSKAGMKYLSSGGWLQKMIEAMEKKLMTKD